MLFCSVVSTHLEKDLRNPDSLRGQMELIPLHAVVRNLFVLREPESRVVFLQDGLVFGQSFLLFLTVRIANILPD